MFGRSNPIREIAKLRAHLDRVGELIQGGGGSLDETAEPVSCWSVRQQLAHVLLADRAMFENVQKIVTGSGHDKATTGKPNLLGRTILALGWIPRGRGQAPESVVPTGDLTDASLTTMLHEARSDVAALEQKLDRIRTVPATVPHFAFGHLTAPQWLRLAHIHARHHLAIVRDILKSTDRQHAGPPTPFEEAP